MQDCPILANQRRSIWSTGANLQDKLCGSGDDLKRTVLFLADVEVDAYQRVTAEKKIPFIGDRKIV
jgi:hypothetical protein